MKLTPFGLTVRRFRLERGLTLKAMAEALGVTSAYLSAIELGDKKLSPEVGEKAVEYFATKVGAAEIAELQDAVGKSLEVLPMSNFDTEDRALLAAFARRLSDGQGVPDDVKRWLTKGAKNNGSDR
ncbi:helix-turn-helix domain-containing protein [Burkholderia ubonensis]|uniref:helix-turn-helix domain-containing protein n=1 Tax=Burkholderia ubonensis TaxID=101571 RepID=UPI000ACF1E95|nr:helix-turn-helix transcriptional regulator [Burkholderia ubonensis]